MIENQHRDPTTTKEDNEDKLRDRSRRLRGASKCRWLKITVSYSLSLRFDKLQQDMLDNSIDGYPYVNFSGSQ